MTDETRPPWISKSLPQYLRPADRSEVAGLNLRLASLSTNRLSKVETARAGQPEDRVTVWPRDGLHVRLLPGGVTPWDAVAAGPLLARAIKAALDLCGNREIAFWGVGHEHAGMFIGDYGVRLSKWIKGELLFSPSVLVSMGCDFFFVCDEQLHFTVVGCSPSLIGELDSAAGGTGALKLLFEDWVRSGGIGFDSFDRQWAERTLLEWCNWY